MGRGGAGAGQDGSAEIVAGGSDGALRVFNMEMKKLRCVIRGAHRDDINSVCFCDESGNMLVSGSDDSLIKIWDRRVLEGRPVSVCVGHTEGITHVAAKGDGVTLISNSKDQSMKLWDLRRCGDVERLLAQPLRCNRARGWDYRMGVPYPQRLRTSAAAHPDDRSVATFRGHCVLKTLIRCWFSPGHTTGRRFAVTGSSDGKWAVYDLLTGTRAPAPDFARRLFRHRDVVRDVAWHPDRPVVVTSSWDGDVALWARREVGDADVVSDLRPTAMPSAQRT